MPMNSRGYIWTSGNVPSLEYVSLLLYSTTYYLLCSPISLVLSSFSPSFSFPLSLSLARHREPTIGLRRRNLNEKSNVRSCVSFASGVPDATIILSIPSIRRRARIERFSLCELFQREGRRYGTPMYICVRGWFAKITDGR